MAIDRNGILEAKTVLDMIKLDQKYILISAGDSEKSQKHSDLPLGKREA